jgi:hypothetical protein
MTLLISVDAHPSPSLAAHSHNPWASVGQDWLDGLRLIGHDRTLRLIFAFMAISAVGEGVMGSLFAPFVLQILNGGELGFGSLVSAQAIGGLAGSFAPPPPKRPCRRGATDRLRRTPAAVFDLMTFNYHASPRFCCPGSSSWRSSGSRRRLIVGATTLMQQCTTDAYRGRVLGAITATGACSTLIGTLLGGAIGAGRGSCWCSTSRGSATRWAG